MNSVFDDLKFSLLEAVEISKGQQSPSRVREVTGADIKSTRAKLNMTQEQFSMLMGVSCGTLRNWEQERRCPEGPARALLLVASKHPEIVLDAIHS